MLMHVRAIFPSQQSTRETAFPFKTTFSHDFKQKPRATQGSCMVLMSNQNEILQYPPHFILLIKMNPKWFH